jgi:type II secretory pathway component PulL
MEIMRMNTDDPRIGRSPDPERGSATLVVFILLTIMVAFIVANSVTLHHLRGELRLIEREQLKKYGTNAPPARRAQPIRRAP